MVIVVLPAYNEASCIGDLLHSFVAAVPQTGVPCRVIVVNDGSTDDTAGVVLGFQQKLDIELINHSVNRGLAEAIRTGLSRAVEISAGDDVIVTMDADNSHPPDLVARMLPLIRDGYDVVIASRYQEGARVVGLSPFRTLLSSGASLLFRTILPVSGVRDYSCGYRAYRATLLKKAISEYGESFITERGFSCMVDILLKLRRYAPAIAEVPLVLRYDQKKSVSKMKVGKTVRQTLWLLLRRRIGLND